MELRMTFIPILIICYMTSGYNTQSISTSMIAIGDCNSTTYFRVGDICEFQMIIMVPGDSSTDLAIQLISSITIDNGTNNSYSMTIAQFYKPTITIGTNFNITNLNVKTQLTSSMGNSQFDQIDIDFGTIYNSNASQIDSDNSIIIGFKVIVIDNGQINSTSMLITGGAEYYNQTEIWVGQTELVYNKITVSESLPTVSAFGNSVPLVPSTSKGNFGYFYVPLNISNARYIYLNLSASSFSSLLTICSVHIMTANNSFSNLDSIDAYVTSFADMRSNTATLNLGFVPSTSFSTGIYNKNNIYIFVAYKVSENAIVGSQSINVTAFMSLYPLSATLTSITKVVTVNTTVSSGSNTIAPTPTVNANVDPTPVPIYGSFNITVNVNFPSGYNNYLQIDAIPDINTNDGLPQVKVCSVVVYGSGENLPCPKCMNQGSVNAYSQNNSLFSTYDSIQWSVSQVINYGLRASTSDLPNLNQMSFSIIGQVLNHTANINGGNVTIPIGFTFGNQTIWVTEGYVIIGGSSSSINNTNLNNTWFSISNADNPSTTASAGVTRAVFFDIYTQPGSLYSPMNLEIIVPETIIGNNVPAATICSVKLLYVGIYATCIQKEYVNNMAGKISYLQRMIQFKNDKAIVSLDSFCNSADPSLTIDPIDGMIRFLIYFQLENEPSLVASPQTYIAVGIQYTESLIFVGQNFYSLDTTNRLTTPPVSSSIFAYLDNSTTSIVGRGFVSTNYVIKIPPNSIYGYSFSTNLSSVISGVNVCNTRIKTRGGNVPCYNAPSNSFLTSSGSKIGNFASLGGVCSINNISTSVNRINVFDDDSILVEVLTRVSGEYSGTFSVVSQLSNTQTRASLASLSSQTVTASAATAISDTPSDNTKIFASISGVDPNDQSSFITVYNNNLKMFKGQTTMIRYNLTITELSKTYDLKFSLTSSLSNDQFEIQKLFISNIGDNFPCNSLSNQQVITMNNGTYYTYLYEITVSDISYYPVNPANISSSTITLDAYIRLPWNTPGVGTPTGNAIFNLNVYAGSQIISFLSNSITLSISDINSFNSTIYSTTSIGTTTSNLNLTSLSNSLLVNRVKVKQLVSINISINIPPYSNLRTILNISTVDSVSGQQFAHIQALRIISAGRNVDGLMNEYSKGFIQPNFYRTAKSGDNSFYFDNAIYDLGIITNTNFGLKIGDYKSNVDDLITVQCDILMIDNVISTNNAQFQIYSGVNFNSKTVITPATQPVFNLSRDGTETPNLVLNAQFTSVPSNPKTNDLITVRFDLSHTSVSTAEAYYSFVAFYLPVYLKLKTIDSNPWSLSYTLNDSAIYFNIPRVHFIEIINCTFTLQIDSSYASLMDKYGKNPLSIKIPYNVMYNEFDRNDSSITKFSSNYKLLTFTPGIIDLPSAPNTPIQNFICSKSSSVDGSNPGNAFTTGWTTGYRSYDYYKSGATYIKLIFKSGTLITKISIKQLGSGYAQFSKYQISYSDDDISYFFLDEQNAGSTSFDYVMNTVKCQYFRIHLTGLVTPSQATNLESGLIINEIYGSNPATQCPTLTSSISPYYVPRSYLYISSTDKSNQVGTLFICDETVDRVTSECYMSTDNSPNTWLVLPKTVASIYLYVYDKSTSLEHLYGVARDLKSYVRSDDNGLSWKAISENEFTTINSLTITDTFKKVINNANGAISPKGLSPSTAVTIGSWTVKSDGVYYSNTNYLTWIN